MLQHGNITDALYKKLMLKPDLFPAVGELLCKQDISRDVVVHLMKLAISVERSAEARTDIYKDFSIVLSVVRVSHVLPRPVKLEIAIKVPALYSVYLTLAAKIPFRKFSNPLDGIFRSIKLKTMMRKVSIYSSQQDMYLLRL